MKGAIKLLVLTTLILTVLGKNCMVAFRESSLPRWSRPPGDIYIDPYTKVVNNMNNWLDEHPDTKILGSTFSRSDDEQTCHYTGYFLYDC